jgi:hypothetical protein
MRGAVARRPRPRSSGITDSFNRADNSSSLGTTDTGQAWSTFQGTWGIGTNRAQAVTHADNDTAYVTTPSADMTISAKIAAVTGVTAPGLIARATAVNNYYMAQAQFNGGTNAFYLFKQVAGSYTQLGMSAVVPVVGDTFAISAIGTSIRVIVNGSTLISVTDSTFSVGTKAGFRCGASGGGVTLFFDDFSVI